MPDEIAKTRYGCNLQGALLTIAAIRGVVPVLHGIPGQGIQNFEANRMGNGSIGWLNGYAVPSTNMHEKHVIFGGGSRLREQIKNLVKVVDGELYIVLSGVESEIISDDVIGMTREIVDQGYEALYYKAPGFQGHARIGYEEIVNILLAYIIEKVKVPFKNLKTVNIFGIAPQQDLFWQGNLQEIDRVLTSLNIKGNRLFGHGQSINNWLEIPNASLNIVFSKWGISAAEKLKKAYGTPYYLVENIGIGPAIDEFVNVVAEKLDIKQELKNNFLTEEKSYFNYIMQQFAECYFAYDFRKKIAIVGEESKIIRYSEFLRNSLGMQIEVAIVTDYVGKGEEQTAGKVLEKTAKNILYNNDTEKIAAAISKYNIELIFGSALETNIAGTLNLPLIIIGNPQNTFLDVRGRDIGYAGAGEVLERLSAIGIASTN